MKLIYQEITSTRKSIAKGNAARKSREGHGKTVQQWIAMLQDHVDVDLTEDHIERLEAGTADLVPVIEHALRTAEVGGLIRRV